MEDAAYCDRSENLKMSNDLKRKNSSRENHQNQQRSKAC